MNRKIKLSQILFLVIFSFYFSKTSCEGSSFLESIFDEAKQAYSQGDFQKAVINFIKIVQSGHQSGEIYYNIANCYFKLNQPGKAILYYEKASKYLKRDKELKSNLLLARSNVKYQTVESHQKLLLKPFRWLGETLNLWELTLLNVILGWILLLGLSLGLSITRKISKKVIGALFLLQIFTLISWSISYGEERDLKIIILADKLEVHSGPGKSFPMHFNVYEGTKLSIKEEYGEWVKVALPNGITGWIESTGYERI